MLPQDPTQLLNDFVAENAGNPTAILLFLLFFYGGMGLWYSFYAFCDVLIARSLTKTILTLLSFVVDTSDYDIGVLIHIIVFFRRPHLQVLCGSVLRLLSRDGADDDHLFEISTIGWMSLVHCYVFLVLANFSTIYALIRVWWPCISTAAIWLFLTWVTFIYCFGMSALAPLRGLSRPIRYSKNLFWYLLPIVRRVIILMYEQIRKWLKIWESSKARALEYRRPAHWGQPYIYSPLTENGSIRLLRISRKDLFGDYACAIVHTTLDQAPDFEAISYHWGEPILDNTLMVDDGKLEVTSRVVEIIQSRASFLDVKLIWIDSVCINQKDLVEKGLQILLMRDIYRTAHRVLVWLGTSSDAFDANSYMMDVTRKTIFSSDQDTLQNLIGPLSNDGRGPALFEFLNHPWWSRAWVVQEIAMAKKVIISYGNEYRNWDQFELFLHNVNTLTPSLQLSLASLLPDKPFVMPAFVFQMPLLSEIRKRCQTSDASLDLEEILHRLHRCQTSDPRDSIYAFLGLTTAALDPLLVPDYTKSVVEIFTDTTRYLCRHDIFTAIAHSGIGHDRQIDSLPSWVPDFSSPKRNSKMHLAQSSPELKAACYRASGYTQPSCELHPSLPLLRTNCLLFDSIAKLGPDCDPNDGATGSFQTHHNQTATNFFSMIDFIQDNIGTDGYPYTKQPSDETTWRFMIGDRSVYSAPIQRPAPPIFGEYFSMVQGAMDKARNILKEFEELNGSREDTDAMPAKLYDSYEQQMRLAEAASTAGRGHRMAVTQQGALCLVPHGTLIGDTVGVMSGAQACSIFRMQAFPEVVNEALESTWTTPNWRFVGYAYVHGFMDGEALSSGRQWEDMCIW